MSWREKAACKGEPLAKFYPAPDRITRTERVLDAIEMCNGCAVLKMCAIDALYSAQDVGVCGVWAGVDLGDTPVWRGPKLKPLKAIAGPLPARWPLTHSHNRHGDDYVSSDEAIAHVQRLWAMNMTNREIAQAAGISLNTLNALLYSHGADRIEVEGRTIRPRPQITVTIAAALLDVPVPSAPIVRVQSPKSAANGGRCLSCNEPMGSRKETGWDGVRYGARGRCENCYQAWRRSNAKKATA